MAPNHFPLLTLPPVSWWIEAVKQGKIALVSSYRWEKQTLRNRYIIGGPNDRQVLSIPVYKPSRSTEKPMTDIVKVAYEEAWTRDHQRSIEAAYRKSPYFDYYADGLIDILNTETEMLVDLSRKLLDWALKCLNTDLELEETDTPDLRETSELVKYFGKQHQTLSYHQVFEDRFGFRENLSVLDLIFNLGPESAYYLAEAAFSSDSSE